MQVDLKAGKIGKRQVAKTALLDAVIWFWFHQVSYQSLFTQQVDCLPAFGVFGLLVTLATGAGIMLARWDRIPFAFRVTVPVLALASTVALLLISRFSLSGTVYEMVAFLFFSVACFGCQLLRVENLAKCDDVKTLTAALVGSLLLYYVLSFALLILPRMVYDAFAILAPLVLLIGARKPLRETERVGKISKKTFFLTPNLLVVIFGIAGGFVFSSGSISSATTLADLLTAPSPSFLLMLLLYMELGVIVSFGLRFRKAMYFVVMNVAWAVGSMLGSLVFQLTPAVPDSLSVVLSVAIVASFFVFQNTWLNGPKYIVESKTVASEDFARAQGLSNRETEVVLLLLEGRSLRYIQNELYISEGTARTHVKRIYAKLGVHSKQELIDYFKANV
ncbi:response regulator transcription factor [Raoultibacter timonensis]|uniref:HTH luxR-type domain-containing protein n=1 Tax=Raoultibacter timonensis TaxID=1907662 RepID=A0ABN6MG61_9ACTN|nr:helix-turn-helix transcriptional regulator [Raoultibacter timonensis]BDE95291.1 hypothetical protein CE91St30_06240 [Raoultibacter timonensis]BDF49894.1 hypothetical protein CE91St31_06240 [Raoultibacter timonensis]